MPTRLISLEALEFVPSGNTQVFEARRKIESFELSFGRRPEIPSQATRVTGISFAKQIHGGLVAERLDHDYILHDVRVIAMGALP